MVKHVAKENGIQPDDKKNLHELIRIPGQADFLKIFRCMFCPDEGMSFVGLSEETFLEHARTRHGEKVTRCRPEKLRRECRICGEVCMTDTELGDHIKREHLHNGKYPFAGFGPKNDSDDSESDSDSDQSHVRKSRSALKAPPSPPRISIRTPKTSWDERTKDFLKKTAIAEPGASTRRKRDDREKEEEDLRESLELVQAKRRRLEESAKKSERKQTTRKKMKIDDDKNESRSRSVRMEKMDSEVREAPSRNRKEKSDEKRDGRKEGVKPSREDWNKNWLKNINKHLTRDFSETRKEDQCGRLRQEPDDRWSTIVARDKKPLVENKDRRAAIEERERWSREDKDRRSRVEDRDRRSIVENRDRDRKSIAEDRERKQSHSRRPREGSAGRRFEDSRNFGDSRSRGRSFGREGRGRGRGRGGGRGRGRPGGLYQERGDDWKCGGCGFHNFAGRDDCRKCQRVKKDSQKPPEPSFMDETRNEIEMMMKRLRERAETEDFVHSLLSDILMKICEDVEDCPSSPDYTAPGMESVDDTLFLSYECMDCGIRKLDKFELFQHLEDDHGVEDEEDLLNSKVKEIKEMKWGEAQ